MKERDELERVIRTLLQERAAGATICPSEVARAVGGTGWRRLMPGVREAARVLAERDEIVVTQKGLVVDPVTARGAIRLRRTSPRA